MTKLIIKYVESSKHDRLYLGESYLKFVKSKPCAVCDAKNTVAHHMRIRIPGMPEWMLHGVGKKPTDVMTIPLCINCHNLLHAGRIGRYFQIKKLEKLHEEYMGVEW